MAPEARNPDTYAAVDDSLLCCIQFANVMYLINMRTLSLQRRIYRIYGLMIVAGSLSSSPDMMS